jgi:O-antigen/teichoic acid export membrane protein
VSADPASEAPAEPAQPEAGSAGRGRAAARGAVYELVGYGLSNVLRLASNLVLTRLLFPEAFGVAALVVIFQQGLAMLSDMGIEPSVIQSERGDEPIYLNTAWSMQVVRGAVLWGVSLLIAYPCAVFYREPDLLFLVPIGSLNVLMLGFASTSLITLRRRVAVARLVLIELVSQVVGIAVIIAWALVDPSAWALVAGGLGGTLVRVVWSHFIDVGHKNRFEWDAASARSIVKFGKWIFAASALSFLSNQGDRLLVGRLVGAATLGIFSVAVYLSSVVGTAVYKVTHGVLYPVFSRAFHESEEELRRLYYRTRLYNDAGSLTVLGGLLVMAPWLIDLLYDERWQEAGWMLQALCIRVAMSSVLAPCETCLFAMGHTRYGFIQNVARTVFIAVGLPVGWHLFGLEGVIWVSALAEFPVLVVLWWASSKVGILRLRYELRAPAFFAGGLGLGYLALELLRALGWAA